jgi:hypothetical protein
MTRKMTVVASLSTRPGPASPEQVVVAAVAVAAEAGVAVVVAEPAAAVEVVAAAAVAQAAEAGTTVDATEPASRSLNDRDDNPTTNQTGRHSLGAPVTI